MDYKPTGSTRRPRSANRTTDITVIYQEDTPQETCGLTLLHKGFTFGYRISKGKLTRTQQARKAAKLSQQAQGER